MSDDESGMVAAFLISAFVATLVAVGGFPAWVTPYVLLACAARCWWAWSKSEPENPDD